MQRRGLHGVQPFLKQAQNQQPPRIRKLRKKTIADYPVKLRWIPVLSFVLPISLIFDLVGYLKQIISFSKSYTSAAPARWQCSQDYPTPAAAPSRLDGLVCTARKPYVTVGIRNMDYKRARRCEVDLSAFNNVLDIDTTRMIAHVEPLVSMAQITRLTVPMNLSLAVVPELDDLTVGVLINGYGIEGSSNIYGLFSDTVVSYEIVLADGRLVKATADNEYADLFYAIPWSQGTLGLLVAAEIKLIQVKQYVKLRYLPVRGTLNELAEAYISSFTGSTPVDNYKLHAKSGINELGCCNNHQNMELQPEFVETIIYSPTEAVCMTGWYASSEEAKQNGNHINRQGWWFKPWFYQHAETALQRGEFVEYIPTRDYYHRHTKSYFWEGKLILPFADQAWFRWLLGWLMPPKIPFLKITEAPAICNYYHENHVLQDLLVPLYKLPAALEFSHQELELYPIWLCPHKLYKHPVKTMLYPEQGFESH
ncbi:hypothetical protein GOP47_0022040 [Adiantum capillus-veneris]|uniref:Delta(24)-sterol reductase n=1 Tax=Adiantum capillus-veneris TaxID=13818 RepID=A0A9D4U8M3_ADICA|nr:hypothetical protein GOP47_0022040 [Adiantum capillus-veneris]